MSCCFMAEYAVEFDNGGFEVLLEDIDDRVVGTAAQRIVVQLGGDAAAYLIGTAVVAAAGALDAQFARREDRDGLSTHVSRPASNRIALSRIT